MNIIILLIIASFTVASGFLLAFIWAVKNGQYDDQHTPSIRILFDDIENRKIKNNKNGQTEESKYDQ